MKSEFKVSLLNDLSFLCRGDISLLEAAREAKISLEYSCRNGQCGTCKTKVLTGSTKILQDESTLTGDDLKAGYILTCCRSATSDIQLDIENIERLNGIQTKISPCRINAIKYLNDNVISIILRLPHGNELNYLAGQYIDVISKNGLRRSYSLANSLRSDGKLELHIQKVLDGEMSDYWFNSAKVNDLLRIEGPLGTFCFRPNLPENLIFLSTGTGIAPVKALLEELEANPNLVEKKNIYVYWGGRSETDFYWHPTFENIKLKFIPVLSRSIENWNGRLGYVQQAVIDDSIDMRKSAVYACGSNSMILSARKLLIESGLDENSFYSDAFVSSN